MSDTDVSDTDVPDTDVPDTDPPGAFDVPGSSGDCSAPIDAVDVSAPDHVIACTEADLRAAVTAGGLVTFDCGPDPVTITLTSTLEVGADVTIDGGGLVTLSGGGSVRILRMETNDFTATHPTLTVQHLRLVDGHSSGTEMGLGTDIDGGGAAIWHRGGNLRVIECAFEDNVGAEWGPDVGGGAIYGLGVGENIVVRSRFTNNRAANGGAIGVLGGPLTIIDSEIDGNTATGRDANYVDEHGDQQGHGGNGGGICMDGQGQRLEICGTVVQNNRGGAFGGAFFRTGYASEPSVIHASAFLDNQIVEDADSNGAGGLYIQGTEVTMTSTTVARNRARGYAGLWILGHGSAGARADLTNVTLADNDVWPNEQPDLSGLGGGLVIGDNTQGELVNCTIVGNTAGFGAGIINVSGLTVRNTVLSNEAYNIWNPLNCLGSSFNTPPGSGSPNLQWPHGDVDMDCTTGITYADPLTSPLNADRIPTAALQVSSPGIGAGTDCPPTDARGNPRDTAHCDLGAVEGR